MMGIFFLFIIPHSFAQVKIMPLGDSITWGKNITPGFVFDDGYRKSLYNKLTTLGLGPGDFTFVGNETTPTDPSNLYRACYKDGARIEAFLSGGGVNYGDISTTLTSLTPNIVILHIGTNNIGNEETIGDYNTSGTIINSLYTLVNKITDEASVTRLFLCKIIPKLSTPGSEIETITYNNAITWPRRTGPKPP
jgi:hypothetical protein